jgi:acyl-CoA thioesterase-2
MYEIAWPSPEWGSTVCSANCLAIQDDTTLLSMITSFQTAAGGLDHQDPMPPAPDPQTLPSTAELLAD